MDINNLITHNDFLNKEIILRLEPYLNTDIINNNVHDVIIDKGKTRTFIGNFYGLLKNELHINSNYWYMNMRINNFKTPMEYNGETTIKILNSEILDLIMKK